MAYVNNVQKYHKLVAHMTLYTNKMRTLWVGTSSYVIITCGAKYHEQGSGNSKRETGRRPESRNNSNS